MMMTFFRAGGYPIFLVLLFTVLLLFVAGRYALKPHPRGLALIRALTLTLVFSAVAGVATNIRATLYGVTNRWEMNPETPLARDARPWRIANPCSSRVHGSVYRLAFRRCRRAPSR